MKYLIATMLSMLSFGAGYMIINPDSQANSFIQGFYNSAAIAPAVRSSNINALIDRPVMSLSLSDNGSIRYLDRNSGKAYKYNFNLNREEIIQDILLINPRSAVWSPINDNFIVALGEDRELRFKLNNSATGSSYYLDKSVISANFSPDGNKIAQILRRGDIIHVSIYSIEGTWEKDIFKGRFDNGGIMWPEQDYVVMRSKSIKNDYVFIKIYLDGRVETILDQKEDPREIWNSSSFIFSKKDEVGPYSIGILDTKVKNTKYLKFNGQSSKCAWIAETGFICGLTEDSGDDKLYRISSGNELEVLDNQFENLKIEQLLFEPETKKLIAVNSQDSKIYVLPLE